MRRNELAITLAMKGSPIVQMERFISKGTTTASTAKMLWMPCCPKSAKVVTPNWLPTALTDRFQLLLTDLSILLMLLVAVEHAPQLQASQR